MIRFVKLVHFIGLILFLGSILTFVVISSLVEGASLESFSFGRKIINTGTYTLTLPGMWILTVTGLAMGSKLYGFTHKFFQIKLTIMVLIVINTYIFVIPAVKAASDYAVLSLTKGHFLPAYKNAYIKESIFGGINVLLTVATTIISKWKVRIKPATRNN